MYVVEGARNMLMKGERQRFVDEEWPKIFATIQRLGLDAKDLLTATDTNSKKSGDQA
jgi:GntR family transcriptional regulator